MTESIAAILLRKQPLFHFIEEALDRHGRGVSELVYNPENGKPFEVLVDKELSLLKVQHDGRVVYRARFAKGTLK